MTKRNVEEVDQYKRILYLLNTILHIYILSLNNINMFARVARSIQHTHKIVSNQAKKIIYKHHVLLISILIYIWNR